MKSSINLRKALDQLMSYCGFDENAIRNTNFKSSMDAYVRSSSNGATPLADLLSYEIFDSNNDIFINQGGACGFFFEITPIVGSNEGIEKNLTLFFNDELPDGGYLQFLIIAGHDVSNILNLWEEGRTDGGESIERITNYRKWFTQNLAKDFASADDGRLARNFRTFVTYSENSPATTKSIDTLIKFQKKLGNKLKTEKLSPRLMDASDLIQIGRDLLQMEVGGTKGRSKYDPYNSLSNQICNPLTPLEVMQDSIKHISSDLESRIFYPKELPDSFSLSEMISLLGSNEKVIPGRFVISYSLAANLGSSGSSKLISQGYRSIHASERDYTRHDVGAKEEAREWREIINIHKKGERFLTENMLVMITAPSSDIDIAEELLKSLWNAEDWKLGVNTNLQLVSLISMLPMMQSSMWKSLSFFKLTRNALSGEVVAKLPIQGEWRGVPKSGVLMMGRRGQLFNFNPYYRIGGGGNYNISMMAPSGSGKSFFLQELATSMIAQDTSVFIMDIGASYKNLCHLLGGEMVRFNSSNKTSLNPFASLSNSGASYIKAIELLGYNRDFITISEITGLSLEQIAALSMGRKEADSFIKEQEGIEILEIKHDEGQNNNTSSSQSHFVTKDSIIYAKAMLSSMCAVTGHPREEAIIERAIHLGITKYGTNLDITKLAKILETLTDRKGEKIEGAAKLADSLYPYTEHGIHGRFFKSSKDEARFDSMLTVFEFEELVNDAPLLSVVLQVILMQITMQFLCGDRTRTFMIIVDEAWMVMDFLASLLERFVRTVRKYGGSVVICTQDLSSFQKGTSQSAILESSTWKLILQQKEEGVAAFAKEESYRPYLNLIRSVRKCSNNKFSEVLFDTNGAKVVGRLVTDPYSTAIYSTESEDYAFLMKEERLGTSKHEAILKLSKKYGKLPECSATSSISRETRKELKVSATQIKMEAK
jgi:type-IV secretion system protein TraC